MAKAPDEKFVTLQVEKSLAVTSLVKADEKPVNTQNKMSLGNTSRASEQDETSQEAATTSAVVAVRLNKIFLTIKQPNCLKTSVVCY